MEDVIGSEHSPTATSNVSSDFVMHNSTSIEGDGEGSGGPECYRRATPPSFFPTNTGDFTTLSESDWHQLRREREEMLLFTSFRDDVNGVIDESLLEGDDDVEFDAEKVQKETEGEEAVNGVLQEYMTDILGKVKRQIDSYGTPDCYTRGTFWEHPKDPLFALHTSATRATGVSPTELYHLDVFHLAP